MESRFCVPPRVKSWFRSTVAASSLLLSVGAYGQNASSLRGIPITNPLTPLDQQVLGFNTAGGRRWLPVSVSSQSGFSNFCAPASASTTTYTCNLTPAISSYGSGGLWMTFKPDVTNTGASTVNVNSLGAKNIQKLDSGSLVNVAAGDLDADGMYLFVYTGTVFVVISGSGSGGSGITDLTGQVTANGPGSAAATIVSLVNAQTGTTYTFLDGDRGKLVTGTNGSAQAYTLPQAGAGSAFLTGWYVDVQSRGAGTLTITPTTSTIDGAASLALTQNQGVRIWSDGTNYFTQRGIGGVASGNMTVTTGAANPVAACTVGEDYYFQTTSTEFWRCTTAPNVWNVVGVVNAGVGISVTTDADGYQSIALSPAATSAATASTLASRDTNANTSFNSVLDGYTTTATAAGTTTLTVASTKQQRFSGTTTQTVTLPVVTTLTLGQQYRIINDSTGAVTVNSSGGNLVVTVAAGTTRMVTCILVTGTTAASWSVDAIGGSSGGIYIAGENNLADLTMVGTTDTTAFTATIPAIAAGRGFKFYALLSGGAGCTSVAVFKAKYDTAGTPLSLTVKNSGGGTMDMIVEGWLMNDSGSTTAQSLVGGTRQNSGNFWAGSLDTLTARGTIDTSASKTFEITVACDGSTATFNRKSFLVTAVN